MEIILSVIAKYELNPKTEQIRATGQPRVYKITMEGSWLKGSGGVLGLKKILVVLRPMGTPSIGALVSF